MLRRPGATTTKSTRASLRSSASPAASSNFDREHNRKMGQKSSLAARLLRRLRVQTGFALVTTLGIAAGLGLTGETLMYFSTANAGEASRSAADNGAFTLAEAGINDALAKLQSPSVNPFNPYLLSSQTTTYNTGASTWSGTLDEATGIWTLTGIGTTRNPTGVNAAPVQRHVSITV